MLVRILLFGILAYIVVRVAGRLLGGVFEGMGYQRPGGSPTSVGLVRDPVCGTFVVPSKALTSGSGSNTRYFCSEKCRQEYSGRS
jgi:YHS domain-containing protein